MSACSSCMPQSKALRARWQLWPPAASPTMFLSQQQRDGVTDRFSHRTLADRERGCHQRKSSRRSSWIATAQVRSIRRALEDLDLTGAWCCTTGQRARRRHRGKWNGKGKCPTRCATSSRIPRSDPPKQAAERPRSWTWQPRCDARSLGDRARRVHAGAAWRFFGEICSVTGLALAAAPAAALPGAREAYI